jgi:hypothetical protein
MDSCVKQKRAWRLPSCAEGTASQRLVTTSGVASLAAMNVSDAKRLKELETKNARLKRLLAEAMLENEVTKEALRKKW